MKPTPTFGHDASPDRPPPPSNWVLHAAAIPTDWVVPAYEIDAEPYRQLFTQNRNYQPGRVFDFGPIGHDRLRAETAWWLWTCWNEGLRKVEPSMLRWWCTALTAMADVRTTLTGTTGHSIADFDPALVIRECLRAFTARNDRLPSPGNLRNLNSIAEHAHLLVATRCTDAPWWAHNVWDLRIDDRIPRRPHEPAGHQPVNLTPIQPDWLREGIRYWLRTALSTELYRWTTAVTRAKNISAYFSPWVNAHHHAGAPTSPALAGDDAGLREAFMDYLDWLRSPTATTTRSAPLSPNQVEAVQSQVQGFYRFMLDHGDQAADATGRPEWAQLRESHARLWAPAYRRRRARNHDARLEDWIGAADMARMVAVLPILSTATTEQVTVTPPGIEPVTTMGLGDPQAARAWMLQALTGRRVSEILMMDYDPLTPIPGLDPDTAAADSFVARLAYQQTKVDGVGNSIPVEASVVALITEQQQWATSKVDTGTTPTRLFLEPRHNHKGLRARPYPSHQQALRRLDDIVNLRDSNGARLRFTSTHRLRHARATELLNNGVPVHVVQRYLGHKSPEMTMRYAATLAATAEEEFLKAKRSGAFGTDLAIDAADQYEITQLSGRTDRILPNGACLLPPASVCDKGNACLTCTNFATDTTHLPELKAQHRRTLELIEIRQGTFTQRHGQPMPESNVWLAARHRELQSLDLITTALQEDTDTADGDSTKSVTGAGVSARQSKEHP